MSTRATLYIHWNDGEQDIKLYHHRDGYVENLWQKLDKALQKRRRWKMRDLYWSNSKNLIECVAWVWGFEQAWPIHWDVEYVYHINYWLNSKRNPKKWKNEREVNYKLRCQSWNHYWEEQILKQPKVLLSMKRWKEKKDLDRKKAEKELWTTSKWREGYLD